MVEGDLRSHGGNLGDCRDFQGISGAVESREYKGIKVDVGVFKGTLGDIREFKMVQDDLWDLKRYKGIRGKG